jgi:chromosome segregation ATPase
LLLEQQPLRASIQDLETYIDGRRKSWSDMQTEIANYKDTLVGMGKALKTKDATLAEHDQEKQRLAVRILDLERQASELTGRRKEREAAYEELQKRLTDHLEAAEQLKAESAVRAKQNEQVLAKAVDNQKLVESLQRGIERRDESLAAIETALETHKATAAELSNTRDKLAKRVDELERGLSDRSQQLQALREDLQLSHEQQRLLETRWVDRDEELERTRQSAEESSSLAGRLTDDLRAAVGDADELRERLENSEQRITDLEEQHSAAVAEAKRVTGELAAQQELVASLEEELRAKQATLGLLERNVHRITDLGASLAALDRSLTETETDVAAQLSSSASYSLLGPIENVGSPTDPEARDEAKEDMLPIEIFMGSTGPETDVVDVGAPTENDARKLVAMIGDQGIDYPLRDGEMTIGRGHSSDIRIPSHFISRVHARIRTRGIATVIEDAGSKNGILVNSARVQRCILHDGDVVSLGGELNLKFIDAAH